MIPEDLNAIPLRPHPHVVILGAGASHAATPEGEKWQQQLPLMRELPNALNLESILDQNQYKEQQQICR